MQRTNVLLIILLLVILVSPKYSHAQMATAQKIEWNVSKVVLINADQDDVWGLLSSLREITVYSKGYVKTVELKGSSLPYDRLLTFSDGTTRTEQIDQVEHVGKFMAYRIKKEALPQGVKNVQIAVFTKSKGEKNTELKWLARIEGDTEAKKTLEAQLNTEFEYYTSGMANVFNKAIPAMKMN